MTDPRKLITEFASARAKAEALRQQGKAHRISITIGVVDEVINALCEYETTLLTQEGGQSLKRAK